MIAHMYGRVTTLTPTSVVLDVAGVGMLLHCTPRTLATLRAEDTVQLHTSLSVREDSLTLYGFAHAAERDLFELLQTASGVGPKLALTTLGTFPAEQLQKILASGDINALTQVSGIGKKGAQKMVLELKDRVSALDTKGAAPTAPAISPVHEHVVAGLVSLGWSQQSAERATHTAVTEEGSSDVSRVLKRAIGVLGGEAR